MTKHLSGHMSTHSDTATLPPSTCRIGRLSEKFSRRTGGPACTESSAAGDVWEDALMQPVPFDVAVVA